MEKLLFVKDTYYLTQGYGDDSFSHQGRFALDVSARSGGNRKIYTPYSGYVAKTYVDSKNAYCLWYVSNEKVLCADGNSYYIVMLFAHPSEIKDIKVGTSYKQGVHFLNDGKTGFATGVHLDFEIAIYNNKEDIKVGNVYTKYNTSRLAGSVDPCKYMFMKDSTKVINEKYLNKTYHFKKESEVSEERKEENRAYQKGTYITLYNLRVRTGPGKSYRQKYVKELSKDGKKHATSSNLNALALYRKGTLFDTLEIIYNSTTDIWAKTYSGYVNIVDGNSINSKVYK